LHFTSLPGGHGIGDLGPHAYEFADFLSAAGQKIWQVLPVNPTGYGDSPYQCFSAFAGNPLLISLERMRDRGLLTDSDFDGAPIFPKDSIDFARCIDFKMPILRRAADNFFSSSSPAERSAFEDFCQSAIPWLDDYALFMACKDAHQGVAWTSWEPQLRQRSPEALRRWSTKLEKHVRDYKFWQYEFFAQWKSLKKLLPRTRNSLHGRRSNLCRSRQRGRLG
jgi:4-alpha-glucanotransferase